jgi:hypothetical protein
VNPVEIACICPGTPHESDTVKLWEPLGFLRATTVRQTLGSIEASARDSGEPLTVDEASAVIAEVYLLYCIESWSLVDADGESLPVSKANVREHLLPHLDEASEVAEVADKLYTRLVVLPLLRGASTSSPSSLIDRSTSATNGNGTTPRKPSKPSSTSITQTAGTAVMTA